MTEEERRWLLELRGVALALPDPLPHRPGLKTAITARRRADDDKIEMRVGDGPWRVLR